MRLPLHLPILLLAATACLPAQSPEPSTDKIDLAVLVTGRPDGARRGEFELFLGEHFTKVGVVDWTTFRPEQADDYDVVVFDCEVRPEPGRIGLAPAPDLPADFARASVLVCGAAIVARPLGLKTDWG